MNRREFIKLLAITTGAPGAVAGLSSSAVASMSTQRTLYEITRERQEAARRDLVSRLEKVAFCPTGPARVSADGDYVLAQGVPCYHSLCMEVRWGGS